MCLAGHSNGGGMVSYVITQTHRFKCAVIVSPAQADWVRDALQTPGGRKAAAEYSGGFDFNENPMEYIGLSSVFQLHKVRTPTLIAVGDDDPGFLMNAIEIYYGIRDTGTDVTLLRYPHEGHVFEPEAMRDFFDREMKFFGAHL
jgi:dipeptidyl aminopeptidase/acylaminoacyl peptidase